MIKALYYAGWLSVLNCVFACIYMLGYSLFNSPLAGWFVISVILLCILGPIAIRYCWPKIDLDESNRAMSSRDWYSY